MRLFAQKQFRWYRFRRLRRAYLALCLLSIEPLPGVTHCLGIIDSSGTSYVREDRRRCFIRETVRDSCGCLGSRCGNLGGPDRCEQTEVSIEVYMTSNSDVS